MVLANYTGAIQEILNGSIISGIDQQLSESTGGLWYIVLFGIPVIMSYMKTENLTIPTVLMLWSVSLYGYLIDPLVANIATITFALGFAVIALNALWRSN